MPGRSPISRVSDVMNPSGSFATSATTQDRASHPVTHPATALFQSPIAPPVHRPHATRFISLPSRLTIPSQPRWLTINSRPRHRNLPGQLSRGTFVDAARSQAEASPTHSPRHGHTPLLTHFASHTHRFASQPFRPLAPACRSPQPSRPVTDGAVTRRSPSRVFTSYAIPRPRQTS